MSDRIAAYLEASRELEQLASRCDGFIADLGQRHAALQDWQRGVRSGESVVVVEAALTDFFAGDPPSWTAVETALRAWIAALREADERWAALTADERTGLEPPLVRIGAAE